MKDKKAVKSLVILSTMILVFSILTFGAGALTSIDEGTENNPNDEGITEENVDYIEIGPKNETVTAGDNTWYHATAYDEDGNDVGYVTEDTEWSIDEDAGGSWYHTGDYIRYTSEKAGDWTVTATYEYEGENFDDSTTLTVNPDDASYFEFDEIENQTAGKSFEITITACDEFGNVDTNYSKIADLIDTTETISPDEITFSDGNWTGDVRITGAQEDVVITATDNDISGESGPFEVEPAEVDYVLIYPDEDLRVNAGEDLNFSAEAYDGYGNLIEDNDDEFIWTNANSDGIFNEDDIGDHPVNATYTDQYDVTATSDTVIVTITPYIRIEGEEEHVEAGETVSFEAYLYDKYGEHDDIVTEDISWGIPPYAGGQWDQETYTTEKAGNWPVVGDYTYTFNGQELTLRNHTDLYVEPTDVDRTDIEPEEDQTIEAGETIDFSAEAYDEYDNLITDDDTKFTWENTDDNGLFDETEPGEYEVTATYEGMSSDTVIVTVEPAGVDYVLIEPEADQTIKVGETIDFSAEAYDEYDNLITDDVTKFTWENTDRYGLFDETEPGEYEVTATYEGVTSESTTVTVKELDPAYFVVGITYYDAEVDEGDTVRVEFTVENTGDVKDTQNITLSVNGIEEATEEIELDEGDEYNGEFTWVTDDAGDYDLEVTTDDTSDTVTVRVMEEEDAPGFTTILLILGAVISVTIYHKKEQQKKKI